MIAGLLLVAAIFGSTQLVSGQGNAPGDGNSYRSTSQISALIEEDSGNQPVSVEPAVVDAPRQAVLLALQILCIPDVLLVNLPLVTK